MFSRVNILLPLPLRKSLSDDSLVTGRFILLHTRPTALQSVAAGVLTVSPVLAVPPATARACLPYWMEATAWAAALLSDATAAAMGRLPASEAPNQVRSTLYQMVRGP